MSSTAQGAASGEPATAWDHRRRVIIALAAHIGQPACVCLSGGVVARGLIDFGDGRFRVGESSFRAELVGALTIERDLVTIHLGDIA